MKIIKKDGFEIEIKPTKSFYFIGVTTTKSSMMKVFPLWIPIFFISILFSGSPKPSLSYL